jgi:hypothetical protein
MAVQIQLRRGTASESDSFTGAIGEVTVDTTNKTLRVHDGATVGGYKVVTLTGGLVPATQLPSATTSVKGAVILNDTITSTSNTQALTAAQGKVLADRDFGVNQAYQDVLSSRSKGVYYTNTTGKSITVSVSATYQDEDGGLTATVGGIAVGNLKGEAPSGTGFWNGTLTFIVPNSTSYIIDGSPNVFYWVELR